MMESCEQPRFLIPLAAIIYRRHTPTSLSPLRQSSVLTVKRMGSSLFPLSPLLPAALHTLVVPEVTMVLHAGEHTGTSTSLLPLGTSQGPRGERERDASKMR
jgi:hypothetical protein